MEKTIKHKDSKPLLYLVILLATVCSMVVGVLIPSEKAYAANEETTVNPYVILDTDSDTISSITTAVNRLTAKTSERFNVFLLTETPKGKQKVSFYKAPYMRLTTSEKKKVMENTIKLLQDSAMNKRDKQRFLTFCESQDSTIAKQIRFLSSDTAVDIASSSILISPFSGVIGVILGLIAIITIASITISIPLDMIYLSSPFFYAMCHRSTEDRPFFISFEAYSALRDNELNIKNGVHANYLATYFRRRAVVIFLVGVCYTFLVSNNIYQLVEVIADVANNISESLKWNT